MITRTELEELHELNKKIFGDDKFVEYDTDNPDQVRHNELMGKYNTLIREVQHSQGRANKDVEDLKPSFLTEGDVETGHGAMWILAGMASSIDVLVDGTTVYYIPPCMVKTKYDEKLECNIFYIEETL